MVINNRKMLMLSKYNIDNTKMLYRLLFLYYNYICNVELNKILRRLIFMKKIKRVLSLLMVGTIFVLPNSTLVQAKEIGNVSEVSIVASTYSFTGYGQINASNVNLRAGADTASQSLGTMSYNETVHIDYSMSVKSSNGVYTWYYVKRSNTGQTGYVAAQYVRVLS